MMKHRAYTSVFRAHLSALALSFVALTTWAQQPTLTWIAPPSDLPQNIGISCNDISADGKVAVLGSGVGYGYEFGYVYTRGRMEKTFAGDSETGEGYMWCISADGLTLGGGIRLGGWNAAIWDLHSGPRQLGSKGGVIDLSADGSAAAIWGFDYTRRLYIPRYWHRDRGIVDIPLLPDGDQGFPFSISADGSIVVGWSTFGNSNRRRAYRWTQQTGTQNLGAVVLIGTISFTYDQSEAFGISPDGQVIVGIAYNDYNEAVGFRNILQGTQRVNISLGDPPTGFTGVYPRRTNQDGSIIVGGMRKSDGTSRAMRWTQAGGLEDLNVTYASLLGQGEYLGWASDITSDGRYIVGWGVKDGKQQGFILDTGFCNLPEDINGDKVVDDADLLRVLFNFGSSCGN